jgi:hypothetical protein
VKYLGESWFEFIEIVRPKKPIADELEAVRPPSRNRGKSL